MAYRVTKAVTKYGTKYKVGDVIETPTSVEESLRRLFGWEILDDSVPSFASMRKTDLVDTAESRGIDVDGLTKNQILDLLES